MSDYVQTRVIQKCFPKISFMKNVYTIYGAIKVNFIRWTIKSRRLVHNLVKKKKKLLTAAILLKVLIGRVCILVIKDYLIIY